MAISGIYSITFRGVADWGMGLLLVQNNRITGADVGGVLYDGSITEAGSDILFDLVLTVPPGATLVQGIPASPDVQKVPFSAKIPAKALETQEPVRIEMPIGPVNVIFKCLRSL
ncbi:MAG: hypothetical protein IIA00_08530 [Proteobacteria bacterium]|nr:hypothetical protein [Pseudomonadota bacterium]